MIPSNNTHFLVLSLPSPELSPKDPGRGSIPSGKPSVPALRHQTRVQRFRISLDLSGLIQ